ncbi:tumor necrosis factor receptor superfamily member 5-like isoform X2 [Carcharodon carcharias]|uniref:tumor necrosis factor receptor superfamily member 5-like isoform X2 n=1 Tax=Carcharodon carcharias TaxID=13397 RepID=UPI001B7DC0A5|nr:tumor necrosis factor receptor superfamily member 5-like isoform X2 [Carcharodon carcharias]
MKLLQYLWLLIQAIQLCHCESATKCNNITQYFMFSRCCAKCPPGTYLISKCTIQKDTECNRCEEGLYQSKWNLADHCQQHTYCDPNGGFVRELPGDTLRDAVCLCAIGKHCINKDCEMCAEDKNCKPGFGVDNPADRKHRDTECKECQSGFYSNVSSPVERCWKWTNCGSQGELKPGNSTTDVKYYLKEMLWRFHKQLKKPERHAVGKVNGATVILLEENWRVGEQASEETSVPIPESLAEVQSLFIAQQEDGKESHLPEQEQAPLSKS